MLSLQASLSLKLALSVVSLFLVPQSPITVAIQGLH